VLEELCGSWAGDPSLGPIFDGIIRDRLNEAGRVVPFNGSS